VQDVPVIIPTTKSYLFSILRNGLFFVAPVPGEVPALGVLEFLHRIVDVLELYLGAVSESSLTSNFSTVFQLLEEMIDSGYPLLTEPNQLMTLVPPPSLGGRVAALVTGRSSTITEKLDPTATSVISWRRGGVSYMQNEIFFDIFEEIDCIIDPNGSVVRNDVRGRIMCNCKMTGMPDLTLFLNDPAVVEDVSLHPCVRLARFQRDRVISFVPPDGIFKLLEYRSADRGHSSPLFVRTETVWRETSGSVFYTVGQKAIAAAAPAVLTRGGTGSGVGGGGFGSSPSAGIGGGGGGAGVGSPVPEGPVPDEVALEIHFPSAVKSLDVVPEIGRFVVDTDANVVVWIIGRMGAKVPQARLKVNMALAEGTPVPIEPVHANLRFVFPGSTVSGLGVKDLTLHHETYKYFKGVRAFLRAGNFHIRS
jgi:AP-3 complex subunit mu